MKVSVIVPAYNEESMLPICLSSLRAQLAGCELVVCDNASEDRTYSIARKYADVVVRERRRGVSYAFNAGITASSGDLLAFTGADCVAYPDWISKFLPFFRDAGIVACYGPLQGLEKPGYRPFRTFSLLERFCIKFGLSWVITGANSIIRREAVEKAGMFDTRLMMFEDRVLYRRVKTMGKVKFLPGNPIKTSIRRIEKTGNLRLFANLAMEAFKLDVLGRYDQKNFVPVR